MYNAGPGSRSPSPVESRHRLSSPTYDEQVMMSQQELEAFDEYECSQYAARIPSPAHPTESEAKRKIASADGTDDWDQQDRRKRRSLDRRNSIDEVFAPLPVDERPQVNHGTSVVTPALSGFTSAAHLPTKGTGQLAGDKDALKAAHTPTRLHDTGFTSAAKLAETSHDYTEDQAPSSSPDVPDQDYSEWFSAKIPEGASTGFQTARTALAAPPPASDPVPLDPALAALPTFTSSRILFDEERGPPVSQINADVPTIVGFSPAINYVHSTESGTIIHDWAKPSAAALARAAAKMKAWEAEMDEDFTVDPSIPEPPEGGVRPALRALDNSPGHGGIPDSPSPAGTGFARASGVAGKLPALGVGRGNKPFKSPLLTRPASAATVPTKPAYVNSPLNPTASTSASTPKSTAAFATPTRPGTSSFAPLVPRGGTPGKSLGLTPRRLGFTSAVTKPKFVTPFKAGMRPGEPGRLELEQKAREDAYQANVTVVGGFRPAYYNNKPTAKTTFFRLKKPAGRQTLVSSGLRPQMYEEAELADMVGDNYDSLKQITPENALFYRFHSRSRHSVPSQPSELLGTRAALEDLKDAGCELATQEWVDNHWSLILWKLAGMVCLQPQLEADPATRRWCWEEVINQLLYRYERELNSGSRPALRLITTHDAPATCPMVLCVTKITWHDGPREEGGSPADRWADVEVTDGWYRLRVAVDDPIERAIQSGHIRPGRKLAVQNARLCHDEGREPAEPLEAYLQMNLQICGNSSHMAPWHAKLGFVREPWVATLDSLTADGGLVTLMDLIVETVYPIAYSEFTTTSDGNKAFLGILNEKEEIEAQDRWRAQREAAAQKIRDDHDRKIYQWVGWAETFEARAGSGWKPTDENEHLSSSMEDVWMNLVDEPTSLPQVNRDLTTDRAGWLAYHARQEIEKARESLSEDIGKELDADFPLRDSRSFRVIVVKDARWNKREPFRRGQLHIWDILSLVQTEGGKPGHFDVGERYLVSNLMPSHKNAWMEPAADAMVYFNTMKTTRFQKVKP